MQKPINIPNVVSAQTSCSLTRAFVLMALEHYSVSVLSKTDEELGGDTALISPQAWKRIAADIQEWKAKEMLGDE